MLKLSKYYSFHCGIYLNLYYLLSLYTLQVEHGCVVATIGGTKGILVVGGATGTDDMVEWLDWETKDKWVVLGKLNRGRGEYISM